MRRLLKLVVIACALGFVFIVGATVLVMMMPDDQASALTAAVEGVEIRETPPPGPPPTATPLERLAHQIQADTLADNIRSVRVQGTRLVVEFGVAPNLTTGMTNRTARRDVAAIAKAADESGVEFDSLFVAGYARLRDQYGNSEEARVIGATFRRPTLDRINWPNFNHDHIYDVADSADVHSAFR